MKLKYLGTAAAEGVPGLFCDCKICRYSVLHGGKNIRTRSQAIVDDTLLIDFPADTYHHVLCGNLDLKKVHSCIVTHSHSDHLYPNDLWTRGPGIAHNIGENAFTMFLTHDGYVKTTDFTSREKLEESGRVKIVEIKPFEVFETEGYTITPLAADHDPASNPVFYIIEKGGKTLLYANDTGYFPTITWEYLKTYGKKFDLVSLDCTGYLLDWERGHMGLKANNKVRNELETLSIVTDETIFVINHFSHNGGGSYDDILPVGNESGFLVSYDGMEIEF